MKPGLEISFRTRLHLLMTEYLTILITLAVQEVLVVMKFHNIKNSVTLSLNILYCVEVKTAKDCREHFHFNFLLRQKEKLILQQNSPFLGMANSSREKCLRL